MYSVIICFMYCFKVYILLILHGIVSHDTFSKHREIVWITQKIILPFINSLLGLKI